MAKNFSNSNSLISDEKDIKYKIKKAEDTKKELQNFCESYFHQLHYSYKILMDEKDKIINDKTLEINDLRNESQCLKRKLSENTSQIETSDTIARRIESYEELFNQMKELKKVKIRILSTFWSSVHKKMRSFSFDYKNNFMITK
ncbi:hypothetical protein BpHYR1_043773 [Brachionus plicatilis]|uniref:Uncharacterized protein n=1 Tax=Brachionus plicatilis TaxID=10195 RepID=A0A3M7RK76_BRAPC|nr:hypothetical protein BpHYR1_043773 [Brachionus plicatilis]